MYTQRRLVLALFAVLALAGLVAGCGGGGSSSSGSTSAGTSTESSDSGSTESSGEAPTKAAFIKEADAICSKGDAAMTTEITDYAKENNIAIEAEEEPSEDQEVELFQAVVLPNIAKQAEEISALTPPEGDEETVEDITDTLTSEVEEAEEADGVPDESTLEEASKKAKAYGLKTCGS